MIFFILLSLAFIMGQLGRLEVFPGVVLYAHDLVLFAGALFYLTKKEFRFEIKSSVLARPLLFVLIAALLSLLLNPLNLNPQELFLSSLYLFRLFLYCLVYFVTRFLLQTKKVSARFLLKNLLLVGISIGGLGFLQLALYPNIRNLSYLGWDPHFGRLVGTFLDPNFTGLLISFSLLLSFDLFYQQKKPLISKNLIIIAGAISFLALLFTFSRSSWLAFFAALFYLCFKSKKLRHFLVLVMIFILLVFSLPKPAGEGGNLARQASSLARVDNLKTYVEIFKKQPLVGFGFDTMRFLNVKYGFVSEKDININHAATGVDNSFLFILVTTGLLGMAAFLFLFVQISKEGNLLLQTSAIALIIHSLFQNSLFFPWVMIWMWAVIALTRKNT